MTDLEQYVLTQCYNNVSYLQHLLALDLDIDYASAVSKLEDMKIMLEELGYKP